MERDEYEKLRNERDNILKASNGRKLSKVAEMRVEEIREKIKNAHREQHYGRQKSETNQS